ncbi:unnamed protein product, partial [Didymodactylos carnosus]
TIYQQRHYIIDGGIDDYDFDDYDFYYYDFGYAKYSVSP